MVQDSKEAPQFEMPRRAEDYRNLAKELEKRGLKVLDAKENAADHRKDAIKYLKDTYNLNGQAEGVISDLELFHQEAEAKKKWSTWDYVKYPFVKTWEVMKAHPYLTTAAIATAAVGGAYYTGALTPVIASVQEWLVSLGVGGAVETAKETVGAGIEMGKDVIGGAKDAAGGLMEGAAGADAAAEVAGEAAKDVVVPETMEELDSIFKALEGSGGPP
jgi:hypothetical protein